MSLQERISSLFKPSEADSAPVDPLSVEMTRREALIASVVGGVGLVLGGCAAGNETRPGDMSPAVGGGAGIDEREKEALMHAQGAADAIKHMEEDGIEAEFRLKIAKKLTDQVAEERCPATFELTVKVKEGDDCFKFDNVTATALPTNFAIGGYGDRIVIIANCGGGSETHVLRRGRGKAVNGTYTVGVNGIRKK